MGGQLTYWCEGCPQVVDFECSKFNDTSWVERRCGCFFNVPGTEFQGASKKRAGQQKGSRKIIAAVDLTQGGLFPDWGGIGIKWKTVNYKGKKLHSTPGKDKPFGKATQFARYCARKSRACRHRLYATQCAKWDRANK